MVLSLKPSSIVNAGLALFSSRGDKSVDRPALFVGDSLDAVTARVRKLLELDGIDVARCYPIQKTTSYIHDRCYETARKCSRWRADM